MSQTDDRVAQLENEILSLKRQLTHAQGSTLPVQALNRLFAHGREVVFYIVNDERLTVTQISDSIASYGYSPVDFTSGRLGWRDILYPKDIEPLSTHIATEHGKGAASMEHEHRIYTKSGEVVWITSVSMPETDPEGKITHLWVKIKDVSRRKRYEEELQDANENLFVTLKSIGEAVIQTDANGNIERLNGAAEKLAGIINLKARNKHLDNIMQFSDKADFATLVDPLKLKVGICKMVEVDEIFMRCGDHSRSYRVSCNVSPIFIGKNKAIPNGYVLVVKDLTTVYDALQAARESEARMQESESTIRGIFDHSADGILLADHNGIVREWSSGYERISGLTKEMTVGKTLWEVAAMGFPPEQLYGEEREKLDNELKELVGNMRLKMITRHVMHQITGEHRILNIQYFPVTMSDRMMLGAISRDVTDEVRTQEQIKHNEQKLSVEKDRLQALGDHFPNGCLFRFDFDGENRRFSFSYLSKTWEMLTKLTVEEGLSDVGIALSRIHPDDRDPLIDRIWETYDRQQENFDAELRFYFTPDELHWAHISTHRHFENGRLVSDGFILDITDRKKAEQQLLAEKERVETLGNNLPNGSLFRFRAYHETQNLTFEYVSATWERTTGVPAETTLEDVMAVMGRIHPDDMPVLMGELIRSCVELSNVDAEARYLHPDGSLRWMHIASHPHIDNGAVVSDGFILDVTARKKAEQEVRIEKERLQALGDNMPNGTLFRFKMDMPSGEMSFDYLSGTWEEMSGVSIDETLADIQVILAYVLPDDMPQLMENIQRSTVTLQNIDTEIRYLHPDGITRMYQVSSHPHREGDIVYSDGFILDITARKKAETALFAEKERLQALGDNFPDGTLFRFKMDTQTEEMSLDYVSGTWEKTIGVSAEAALADINTLFAHVMPDDLPDLIARIRESVDRLGNIDTEVRYQHPVIGQRWYQISSHPHREGHIVFSDGFILDITERKKTEEELAVYRVELERLVKERTEELEATNEELYATNEELYATNEEFSVTNEELHTKNTQLRTEIAARMEVMRKLEDSENKVRNFISQSFEGIMILDEQGRVIEWNEALEKMTGLSHTEAMGQFEWDLLRMFVSEEGLDEPSFGKLRQTRLGYMAGGREQTPVVEEQTLYLNGSKRYMQVSMFPIELAETCYFGRILRDITEQKLADMELEQYRTQLEKMVELKTRELVASQERLTSLSDNLPGGVIYQMMDKGMTESWFTYISGYFADMFEISVEDAMSDISLYHSVIYPDDQARLIDFYNKDESQNNIDVEYRIVTKSGKLKWIHMRSSHHSNDEGARVWDGFMIDVTARKQAEQELENTRRQQAILIKVLQIVQSADNLPAALNASLSEMGRHTDVSRAYIFEKSADGTTFSNTYEWCNEGIAPAIDELQDVPAVYMQPWFDIFNSGKYICTADINTLGAETAEVLSAQGVKSIVVFPLAANGINYGFVGFDECGGNREWDQSEIDLLISLSQIISTTTRRHQAETAMQLSQQTMRTVLDNIDANIYVADFDSHKLLFANKKIKEVMGEDIEGKECWKVMQDNPVLPCESCPRPHLRDKHGRPTGLYHWEQWNTNTKKWYESTDAAIEWVDGRLVHMEYATDITDRKKAEEAVRQSEEMYRQLTVASPDAIVVCNPDGQLRYISPKATELFGVAEDTDVSLLRVPKFIHPHDRRQAYSLFRKMYTDNVTFLPQLLLVRQDGSDFIGEISVATVKDPDGHTTSLIMVIRDITRRKMDEMELIRAKEKAEESDKLKSAFLANMSHEIRTPINGIIGFLHFLGSDSLSPKRRQEYINIINNSSIQLVKLIDDIIDVAKIEAKQMVIRPVPLHINELMSELQVFFETYVQANNKERIALILDDSQAVDSCITYVDPMRLRQVLNNLIGNAVKFTEKGFIRIGYRQSAPDQLEFVVEDSGIGLAPDQLDVIFERFRQAELSNSRQYGGTGLGLTISRSLVQLMGGDMWVESTEGAGSTFYFTISYLPVAYQDEQIFEEEPGNEFTEGKPLNNKSILVVEPKLMKYKYYEKLISATGARVTQAETLQQWLEYITQTNHIDTVIADVSVLKDEDIDSIRRIKYMRAGLPVILILPGGKENYQQVIRDCQCNMTIEIPVDSVEIEQVLKRYAR